MIIIAHNIKINFQYSIERLMQKKLLAINKKIYNFYPIIMKLRENYQNYLYTYQLDWVKIVDFCYGLFVG